MLFTTVVSLQIINPEFLLPKILKYLLVHWFGKVFTLLFLFGVLNASGQPVFRSVSTEPFGDSMRHWYGIRDAANVINPVKNQPRYNESQTTEIANNILLFQRNNGGWPKNYDMQAVLTKDQVKKLMQTKETTHTTFDNGTTYTHVVYLARAYALTKNELYRDACLRGINFILLAQYSNGGWPQYFPLEKGNYSTHITFNDGALIGIMRLLKKIKDNDPDYAFLDEWTRQQVEQAYQKGIECILKMQITNKEKLTVWCQQHDETTLQPAWARAFEPPSICNGESAEIVKFLMSIDHPEPEIIRSIQASVKWFQETKILNTRIETVEAPTEQSKWREYSTDKVVVIDSTALPIWTRYYELGTGRPLFCDRNSEFLYSLAEVSRERRVGYSWYTYAPQEVLDNYAAWQKQWIPAENVLVQPDVK